MKNIYKYSFTVIISILISVLLLVHISKIKGIDYINNLMTSNNSKIEAIAVLNNKEQTVQGTVKFTEQDKDFQDKWFLYHKENANLRVLCSKCNNSKPKSKRNIYKNI